MCSFKNNNHHQRAKGITETQKWANNKRAEGVAVIPCNWPFARRERGRKLQKNDEPK